MSIQARIIALGEIEETDVRLAAGEHIRTLLTARDTGRLIECLDDGFVRLVDHMGDDAAIVQAARVSYGAGTKSISDDRSLIRYLMHHRHTSPFEMIEFKFHIRVPMDCWRQWIRHRTASVNETSTRYSEAIDSMQVTQQWRSQSAANKQGSSNDAIEWPDGQKMTISADTYLSDREVEFQVRARSLYEERLRFGIAREQARKDLPLSTYTEAYWKIDGHNLLHFLELRLDNRAQLEIQVYARAIADLIKSLVPLTWEAFEDYRLKSIALSYPEQLAIHRILDPDFVPEPYTLSKGEQKEFCEKIAKLGFEGWG